MTWPRSSWRARVAAALVVCAGAGCTIEREYAGESLTPERMEVLTTARTKAEVLERFGPPMDMGIQLDGSVFIYRLNWEANDDLSLALFQANFDYTVTDQRTDRLIVLFDKQGNKTGQGLDLAVSAEDYEAQLAEDDEDS
jgi:outer membrane protein assembly factor BamE (lipoprotein component of BamABCDE complex)